MKVLFGTTNPSKVKRFAELLSEYSIEFYTLKDLGIVDEPIELGKTPEENAILKALFYSKYFDVVICNDSGLYFEELSIDDDRQPGLNIRTPNNCNRLNDEEMIAYYSNLIKGLGGKVSAYYLDGIAVFNKGRITSFMDNGDLAKSSSFYMVDKPTTKRHIGWPLDSLSINKITNKYFVDKEENDCEKVEDEILVNEYRNNVITFLKKSLEI